MSQKLSFGQYQVRFEEGVNDVLAGDSPLVIEDSAETRTRSLVE